MPTGAAITRVELVKQLGSALGDRKAEQVVHDAAIRAGLALNTRFDQSEVERILEILIKTSGIVGTVARFAKARIILKMTEAV